MNLQKLVSLISSEKLEEAYKKLSRIIKRSPRNAEAWFLLSFVYQKQRQRIYSLEKALKADPDFKKAAHRLKELNTTSGSITPISTYFPAETIPKKSSQPFKVFINIFFAATITISVVALVSYFIKSGFSFGSSPNSQATIQAQINSTATMSESDYLTKMAASQPEGTPGPPGNVEVILIESQLSESEIEQTSVASTQTQEVIAKATSVALELTHAADEAEIYATLDAESTATAAVEATQTAIVVATAEAIAASATATAEAEAARGPSLDVFINQLKNGNSSQVVGIYVEGTMALKVVGQPSGNPGWVNSSWGTATYFAMVKQYTGNDGLLAHNYLSGGSFFYLYNGQSIYLIYGNGTYRSFSVSNIRKFQATNPYSTSSNFVDLNTGQTLNTTDTFYAVFGGSLRLTLQTCITRDGNTSWGRIWVISSEY